MQIKKSALLALALVGVLATACTMPLSAPTPTPLILPTLPIPTSTPVPSPTALLAQTASLPTGGPDPVSPGSTQVFVTQAAKPLPAATQPPSAVFCADARATALIDSFKAALQSRNGTALASLVSPVHGMDARLYRNGRVVNYDQQHAKFVFESTYSVDWGLAPGSGLMTKGSFHEVVLPDLLDVFTKAYTLSCNQVQVGGASYPTTWPYSGINFYSVYYPGSAANTNMDWHTWLVGMHYSGGRPFLYGILQYKWEP